MIFDAHSDMWVDITYKRLNGEENVFKNFHLKKFQEGKISGNISVIWVENPYYENVESARERTKQIMISITEEYKLSKDVLSIVHNIKEVNTAIKENKFYTILGLEGLDSVGDNLELIDEYYNFGARHVSLTWNFQNSLASGIKSDPDLGLSKLGREAVKKIYKNKMILDMSHISEKAFWDVIDIAEGLVVATHSNAKTLCPSKRNLDDAQIKIIRDTGGVIGFNCYREFVSSEREKQTIEESVNHIKYIADLVGVSHIGIGFDHLDYMDEYKLFTQGLEKTEKSYNILNELQKAGFNKEEIELIARGNFLRVIKETLK